MSKKQTTETINVIEQGDEAELMKLALAHRIRKRREDLGISRPAMAKRLGMKYPGYSHKETGEREISSSELAIIARVLGVSTDYLLGQETEDEHRQQELTLYYNGLPEPIQIAELEHLRALHYAHHPKEPATSPSAAKQSDDTDAPSEAKNDVKST